MIEEYPDDEPRTITAEDKAVWYIFPAGLMPGMLISPETIQRAVEADQRRADKKNNKNKRPPKPPSRPNANIGRLALGNT